jgi:hypothetical protein
MRNFLITFLLFITFAVPQVQAQGGFDPKSIGEKLQKYDVENVKLAKEYMTLFGMQDILKQSVPAVSQALLAQVKQQNPSVNEAQIKKFNDVFFKAAFVDNTKLIEDMTLIICLDIFSKEELSELVKFYSTKVGQSIIKKMPQLIARIPEINQVTMNYIIPLALEAARAEIKKEGLELKL